MEDCESCSKKIFSSNNPTIKTNSNLTNGSNIEVIDNDRQVRELELELAQTKLALVEAECKNQVCNYIYKLLKLLFFFALINFCNNVDLYLFLIVICLKQQQKNNHISFILTCGKVVFYSFPAVTILSFPF